MDSVRLRYQVSSAEASYVALSLDDALALLPKPLLSSLQNAAKQRAAWQQSQLTLMLRAHHNQTAAAAASASSGPGHSRPRTPTPSDLSLLTSASSSPRKDSSPGGQRSASLNRATGFGRGAGMASEPPPPPQQQKRSGGGGAASAPLVGGVNGLGTPTKPLLYTGIAYIDIGQPYLATGGYRLGMEQRGQQRRTGMGFRRDTIANDAKVAQSSSALTRAASAGSLNYRRAPKNPACASASAANAAAGRAATATAAQLTNPKLSMSGQRVWTRAGRTSHEGKATSSASVPSLGNGGGSFGGGAAAAAGQRRLGMSSCMRGAHRSPRVTPCARGAASKASAAAKSSPALIHPPPPPQLLPQRSGSSSSSDAATGSASEPQISRASDPISQPQTRRRRPSAAPELAAKAVGKPAALRAAPPPSRPAPRRHNKTPSQARRT